jgi:hypothetical protein
MCQPIHALAHCTWPDYLSVPGVKRPEPQDIHSPPPSVEVKNERSYTSVPIRPPNVHIGKIFTFSEQNVRVSSVSRQPVEAVLCCSGRRHSLANGPGTCRNGRYIHTLVSRRIDRLLITTQCRAEDRSPSAAVASALRFFLQCNIVTVCHRDAAECQDSDLRKPTTHNTLPIRSAHKGVIATDRPLSSAVLFRVPKDFQCH